MSFCVLFGSGVHSGFKVGMHLVCPLSMLLTDDGSEIMGVGNFLYIYKCKDTGVQCF